jgi:hypothetical protein
MESKKTLKVQESQHINGQIISKYKVDQLLKISHGVHIVLIELFMVNLIA